MSIRTAAKWMGGRATSSQGPLYAVGVGLRASVTITTIFVNGPLAANLTTGPLTWTSVGPAIFEVRGDTAHC
jgi:hypothetical protein